MDISDLNRRNSLMSGCGGFTLLEIIIALSVIGIAVIVAIQLFSANLRAIAASEGHVNAAAHAEAVMRSVVTDEEFPNNAVSGISRDGFRYESSITKVFEDRTRNVNVDIYQVKVAVYWNEGPRQKSVSLVTLKLTERKI
jgi:prepilin-type N-terminal cleavage/methylation domain-containing protein